MSKYIDLHEFVATVSAEAVACPIYCLADHAGMPGLHREMLRANVEWRSLFAGTREEAALSVAPLLFRVDSVAGPGMRTFLSWLSELGTYASALLFVSSPLTLPELASRLALRLDARISEDCDVLFRFYDPRIFEKMLHTLLAPQRQAFLCCAESWWFAGRTGELHQVASEFCQLDLFSAPLNLSEDQEFSLLDASENDQVIELVVEAVPEQYSLIPPSQRYDFVVRHVSAARQFSVSATHELALYCAIALSKGDDFSTLPDWSAILGKVHSGELSFTTAVGQLDV